MNEEDDIGGDAPCMAHLLVDGHLVDPRVARDVARFRRAERARLIAKRALSSNERDKATRTLIRGLKRTVDFDAGPTIAAFWPIRGEPDLRPWMHAAHEAGVQVLLPVVTSEHAPLEFHSWSPTCKMTRGIWNILEPANGVSMTPDIVVAPLVGIDDEYFRLGNGGGYYDRTLARLEPRPRIIGVGFANCRLPTIFPMPWDVPMAEVLLSDGTHLGPLHPRDTC